MRRPTRGLSSGRFSDASSDLHGAPGDRVDGPVENTPDDAGVSTRARSRLVRRARAEVGPNPSPNALKETSLPGRSCSRRLARRGPIAPNRGLSLLHGLCGTLAFGSPRESSSGRFWAIIPHPMECPSPQDERKLVTVLFAELAGPTEAGHAPRSRVATGHWPRWCTASPRGHAEASLGSRRGRRGRR